MIMGHWIRRIFVMMFIAGMYAVLPGLTGKNLATAMAQETLAGHSVHLQGAKIYLKAGDYRRAIEACQRHIDDHPSVESYVYLAYVYQALDGYLMSLVKQEDYVKVEQLSL